MKKPSQLNSSSLLFADGDLNLTNSLNASYTLDQVLDDERFLGCFKIGLNEKLFTAGGWTADLQPLVNRIVREGALRLDVESQKHLVKVFTQMELPKLYLRMWGSEFNKGFDALCKKITATPKPQNPN